MCGTALFVGYMATVVVIVRLCRGVVDRVRGRVGKSMAISLFLALPEIRAVDAMPCL